MSKILKSVTLGDVKNGGIFRALGKEFVKLDADEHGCLVLAKEIWTRMPFREGDDPECPNDLRRSEIMPYLGNCLAEFTKNGTPLSTFIPLRIDLQDTTGQNEYGIFEVRIGLLTLRGYGKYWRLIPKVDAISVFREKRFNKPGFDAILNGVKEIVVVVGLFKFKLVGWRCFRVIQQEVVHIVFLVRNEIAIVVIVCVLFCAKHNGADAIHV